MVKKDDKMDWTTEEKKAFEEIKSTIVEDPILVSSDYTRPFYVYSFSLEHTCAAVLTQKSEDKYEHPIAFMSAPLKDAELRYPNIEKQAYALSKETQQCSNTVILLENTQQFHATTTSAPSDLNNDQPESPTVLLEVSLGNEAYDWTKNSLDDNDDVILALKELDQEIYLDDGMEMAAIPEWLMRSMQKIKQMIEVQPIDDIHDYLARSDKEKEPKRAEILSHIARNETGIRIAQIAIPIAGVTSNIATPMDFQITSVSLGHTSRKQEF
ncbi:uncharacterized protein LOC131057339 [Cryptomeria japonica]|uniref:uncharacterized protein LOC131057339 n=1 Tax=Cryptomeria japonica TaxID=3369 RepID=UPI0027DA1244|nr:uncharacterized protein LOC131057339 [Cryptomeria japonica]